MSVNVAFGGVSLQTFDGNHGIIVQSIEHAGKSAKAAQRYALSHGNRSVIPFVEYPNKPITVTGKIVGTSTADCDAQIDTFNSMLLPLGGNLDFDYNGGSLNRRYIATAINIDVQRPNGLSSAEFTINFMSLQPFGQDTTATTPTLTSPTGRTLTSYQDTISFAGTAPYQLPIITVTCTNPVTSAINLITNPGFEVDLSGWSNASLGTATRTTGQHNTGVAALQMVNAAAPINGNYGWEYYTATGLTRGNTYTLSYWLKGNAGGEVIKVVLGGLNGSGAFVITTLTTSWQQIFFPFVAPYTSQELDFESTGSASGTWFLDDVSLVSTGNATISIGNDNTGQQINTFRSWAAGDVLVVDCTQNIVTVNGSQVTFSGAFPAFAPSAGVLDYYDNFLSRTFSISVAYTKMYL